MRAPDEDVHGDEGDALEVALAAALEASGEDRALLLSRLEREDPAGARRVRSRLDSLRELGFSLDAPRIPGRAPARFGRFTRIERVATGGMGEVHLARDEASGELAAIKLVRPDHARFEGARRRFRREIEALEALAHPAIVRVLDVGEEEDVAWLALEWIGGASLEEALDRLRGRPPGALGPRELEEAVRAVASSRPFPEPALAAAFPGATHAEVAARIALQIARALAAAHERGVLHRDLKPSNVLVTPAGRVLLADFGLALPRGADRMTRAGSWLGSLPYAAPEQLAGDVAALDDRADVYSLGATLYELLTLRTPFLGGPEERVRRRIALGDREPVRRLAPSVPPALAAICELALDPDPRRRPPSARTCAEELERALAGRPVRVRRPPPWVRMERALRRRPGRAVAAGLALVVALSALAFGLRERALASRLTRLADAELAQGLVEEARAFWPASPETLPAMASWIGRAVAALAREELHQRERERLERRAQVYTEADRARDEAPARAELETLARELLGLALYVERGDRLAPQALLSPEAARALDAEVRALAAAPAEELVAALRERIGSTRAAMLRDPLRWRPDLPQLASFEAALERAGARLVERTTWRLDADLDAWRHASLGRLLAQLAELRALAPRVRAQLATTRALAELAAGEGALAWAAAREAVHRSPIYAGIELEPAFGLLPLGADARSGLWEFLLVASGEPPRPDGLAREEDGLVLALLPGGRFVMGSDDADPRLANAQPAHALELAPFLVAERELSFAQAERLGGLPPDLPRPADGRLPLTIDWVRATLLLAEHGLALPTEAQWEHAARAGGLTPETLAGHANVLDRKRAAAVADAGLVLPDPPADFDDGFVEVAPIGSFAPDALGLHDLFGNVSEWCRDPFVARGYATLPPRAGDGLRASVLGAPTRVVRGGSWIDPPGRCQPALRAADWPTRAGHRTGVRAVRALSGAGR